MNVNSRPLLIAMDLRENKYNIRYNCVLRQSTRFIITIFLRPRLLYKESHVALRFKRSMHDPTISVSERVLISHADQVVTT